MKKLIFIFCLISLISCKEKEEIYKQLHSIGMEIINDPDRILNLKYYYPGHYSDSLIFNSMKDTTNLKRLRDLIKNDFNHIDSKVKTFIAGQHKGSLSRYKDFGYKNELKPENVYCYVFQKGDYCLEFNVIKINYNFYLFHIIYGICFPAI